MWDKPTGEWRQWLGQRWRNKVNGATKKMGTVRDFREREREMQKCPISDWRLISLTIFVFSQSISLVNAFSTGLFHLYRYFILRYFFFFFFVDIIFNDIISCTSGHRSVRERIKNILLNSFIKRHPKSLSAQMSASNIIHSKLVLDLKFWS